MPKRTQKITLNQDFTFTSEAELNAKIAAFRGEHEASRGQRLAMDARRSLGPVRGHVLISDVSWRI